jgi:hypothetical protein
VAQAVLAERGRCRSIDAPSADRRSDRHRWDRGLPHPRTRVRLTRRLTRRLLLLLNKNTPPALSSPGVDARAHRRLRTSHPQHSQPRTRRVSRDAARAVHGLTGLRVSHDDHLGDTAHEEKREEQERDDSAHRMDSDRSAAPLLSRGCASAVSRLGYVEGQDFRIEFRTADGRNDRLPALAAELVALKPNVIIASTCRIISAATGSFLTVKSRRRSPRLRQTWERSMAAVVALRAFSSRPEEEAWRGFLADAKRLPRGRPLMRSPENNPANAAGP